MDDPSKETSGTEAQDMNALQDSMSNHTLAEKKSNNSLRSSLKPSKFRTFRNPALKQVELSEAQVAPAIAAGTSSEGTFGATFSTGHSKTTDVPRQSDSASGRELVGVGPTPAPAQTGAQHQPAPAPLQATLWSDDSSHMQEDVPMRDFPMATAQATSSSTAQATSTARPVSSTSSDAPPRDIPLHSAPRRDAPPLSAPPALAQTRRPLRHGALPPPVVDTLPNRPDPLPRKQGTQPQRQGTDQSIHRSIPQQRLSPSARAQDTRAPGPAAPGPRRSDPTGRRPDFGTRRSENGPRRSDSSSSSYDARYRSSDVYSRVSDSHDSSVRPGYRPSESRDGSVRPSYRASDRSYDNSRYVRAKHSLDNVPQHLRGGFERTRKIDQIVPVKTVVPGLWNEKPPHFQEPFRRGWKLNALHFGVFDRDGLFVPEYDCRVTDGHIDLSQNGKRLMISDNPSVYIELSFPPRFEAYTGPSDGERDDDGGRGRYVMVTSYDAEFYRIMPFVGRTMRLTFSKYIEFSRFLSQAELLPIPKIVFQKDVSAEGPRNIFEQETLDRLSSHLGQLDIIYAFQLEAILHDGTLFPHEIQSLMERVSYFDNQYGRERTEAILREIRTRLDEAKFQRIERLTDIHNGSVQSQEEDALRGTFRARVETVSRLDLDAIISECAASATRQLHSFNLMHGDTNHVLCRHLYITPSGWYLEGPILEQSNSVIRKFHKGADHFLRVSFVERDLTRLRINRYGDSFDTLKHHVYNPLVEGIALGGRHYQFLGYSQSSLRNHTAWFVAEFGGTEEFIDVVEYDEDGEFILPDPIDAEAIRQSFGDFTKVQDQPTMYGARLSQSFTSSHGSITLRKNEITSLKEMEVFDNFGLPVSNFSDGAGTMSKDLRDLIWSQLVNSGNVRQGTLPPDVFQIRIGGSKGVIALDNQLRGIELGIRPSQEKFKAHLDNQDGFTINIAESFTRPIPLYLNRPLVSAMNDLGIKTAAFQKLLNHAIAQVTEKRESLLGVKHLLIGYGFTGACGMYSLVTNMEKISKQIAGAVSADSVVETQTEPQEKVLHPSNLEEIYEKEDEILKQPKNALDEILKEEPFLHNCIELISERVFRDFKTSMRIPVPNCWNVVGVPDEDLTLKEDEIYCCIRDTDGNLTYIEGKVGITRSPTLHPGDIRVVRAIGKVPDWQQNSRKRDLHNCVVLPVVGKRSIASMMGGGDLDGDTYQIITVPELVPQKQTLALDYKGFSAHRLGREATIADIAQSFVRYIMEDTIGIIAINHLRIADGSPSGGMDPRCIKLANQYSTAVDFAKTGVPVRVTDIVGVNTKSRPDFLKLEDGNDSDFGYYKSTRILGELYRSIPKKSSDTRPFSESSANTGSDGQSQSTKRLKQYLTEQVSKLLNIADIAPKEEDVNKVKENIENFQFQLRHISSVCNFPRRPGKYLSEEEIYVGTILSASDKDRKGRKNAVAELEQQTSNLVSVISMALTSDDTNLGGRLLSFYRAWLVALEQDTKEFGVKIFRWVILGLLLNTLKDVKEQGPTYSVESGREEFDRKSTVRRAQNAPQKDEIIMPQQSLEQSVENTYKMPPNISAQPDVPDVAFINASAQRPPKSRKAVKYKKSGAVINDYAINPTWAHTNGGPPAPKTAPPQPPQALSEKGKRKRNQQNLIDSLNKRLGGGS